MEFERLAPVTAVGILAVQVQLSDIPASGAPGGPAEIPASQSAVYQIEVQMSDGTVSALVGDLVPYLTPDQISGLIAFIGDVRAKAQAEVLGVTA